jgi:hypothetical protein
MTLATITATSLPACAPELLTPEQARDRMYDHLGRAEAHRLERAPQLVRNEQNAARRYRRLIQEGKTTTVEQALSLADRHRQRADAYRLMGYTRFVPGELKKAAGYEDFAVSVGGFKPPAAQAKAREYWDKAARYDGLGLKRFAEHYRRQGEKLQADAQVRTTAPGGEQ